MGLRIVEKQDKARVEYKIRDDKGQEKVVAVFHCRLLAAEAMAKIMEETKKVEWDAPTRKAKRERFESPDLIAFRNKRWVDTIADWEGVEGPDGAELACTDENKMFVLRNAPDVVDYVYDELDRIEEALAKERKDAEKNS